MTHNKQEQHRGTS